MFKKFLSTDDRAVGFFAAANVGASGFSKVIESIAPTLDLLLTAGQIAVAIVTVVYVWRKAINVKKDK